MPSTLNTLFLFLFLGLSSQLYSNDTIVVQKKGVKYRFMPFDERTDNFVKNDFPNWENETFDIFNEVKDPEGIAIDLGAWIGTTAIWLSNNFHHVIAVDADSIALKCLTLNLQASGCKNVSICARPVSKLAQPVVFGARGKALNESTSYIKDTVDTIGDSVVYGIPFKQLIHDYVYANKSIEGRKISFIKCDIEGGEENILEEILYFAYHNKTQAFISFHLDWWKNKKISDFENLFTFFKTNCPHSEICEYIRQNPYTSILFTPLADGKTLNSQKQIAFQRSQAINAYLIKSNWRRPMQKK